MKLAADDDNANLILIWPHRHFSTKEIGGTFLPKVPVLEKMRYWYAAIKFVRGSSTGTWSPEKYVTDIQSSNLFVV